MVLESFRLRNVVKKTDKFFKSGLKEKKVESGKIKTIFVLADELHAEAVYRQVFESFPFDRKHIQLIVFAEQKMDKHIEKFVCRSDFGLFGTFKNKEINELLKTEVDLLLNYEKNNVYLDYLVAFSKAKLKVGFHNDNKKIYDLMIDEEGIEIELFLDELKKYLKILNKI